MTQPSWPDPLSKPTPAEVSAQLHEFWATLLGLSELFYRHETILAFEKVCELRRHVLAMMLAANGINYPQGTKNLNLYLGESQRRAIEKTLWTTRSDSESPLDSLIAQAVSLVVIYQWYAPQLAAAYAVERPVEAEAATLASLQNRLESWPLQITTE